MARMKRLDPAEGSPTPLVFEWTSNTFIGRGLHDGLSLDGDGEAERHVSQLHAVIAWNPRKCWWEVRDLGSANGTMVGGTPLSPGRPGPLVRGTEVHFGPTRWAIVDVAPPAVRARCRQSDDIRVASDGVLLLPDERAPIKALVEGDHGWVLCEPGDDIDAAASRVEVVRSGDAVPVGDQQWTVWLPTGVQQQTYMRHTDDVAVELLVEVSSDQERIAVATFDGDELRHHPPRRHHELIWLLARARIHDEEQPRNEPLDPGWRTNEEIAAQLGLPREDPYNYLNVLVHRCRKLFDGPREGRSLIERDKGKGRLRLGLPATAVRIVNHGTEP